MISHYRQFLGLAIVIAAVVTGVSHSRTVVGEDIPPKRVHEHSARDTLTVVEMNHGDELRFKLRNGEERSFVLTKTEARIIEHNRGGMVYSFDCHLLADGEPLLLRRYVCSQETFYEPWVINGVRLWLSSSKSVFDLVPIRYPKDHHPLNAHAMVVVQDATLPICPQPMRPWFPLKEHFIDVGNCYNGDDPWLGPYLGQACHVGLDINMPTGTPLYTPINFDDHWIFSGGHRWRGVRRWDNGDVWGLQSHHVDKLLLEEHTKITAGTHYAEAAGKGIGSHAHSHFEFRLGREVMNPGQLGGIEVDPWILFWQIFETDKDKKGVLQARFDPLAPAKTGVAVKFAADLPADLSDKAEHRYYWTFGDGGWASGPTPEHVFVRPGVYPVTLVVEDGRQRAAHTQHITISGEPLSQPALVLDAEAEVTFRPRPAPAADVYGWPIKFLPHTVRCTTAPGGEAVTRRITLKNAGGGELPAAQPPQIEYLIQAAGWLQVTREGTGNGQQLVITAQPHALPVGRYEALVSIHCPGAINPRQGFHVELRVRPSPDAEVVIVDDADSGFYATPYFWVGHQFLRCPERGYRDRYLTNGSRAAAGEFVRFTPDLAAGRYEVSLHEATPVAPGAVVPIRIHHAAGENRLEFASGESESRVLGVFDFKEGTEGWVEFHAEGSRGGIIADALVFRLRDDP